jgi:signal transduction histidine kinase
MRDRRSFLASIGYRATGTRTHVRWVMLACSLAAALNAPFDVGWPHSSALVTVRIIWIAVLLTTARLQRHSSPRVSAGAYVVACIASAAAITAAVGLSGGIAGSRGGLLLALPLVVLLLVPTRPSGALAAAVTGTLGGVYLWTRESVAVLTIVEWTVLSLTLDGLLLFASASFRRLWKDRLAAEHDRVRALEQLQASERVRAETEHDLRLALIAAEMAHEINNPLLIATANLDFAAKELAFGGAGADDLVPALHDAHQGLARIRDVVADLRAAANAPGTTGGRATLDAVVSDALARARAREPGLGCQAPSIEPSRVVGEGSVLASALMHVLLAAAHDGRAIRLSAAREAPEDGPEQARARVRVQMVAGASSATERARARALPLLLARVMLRRFEGDVLEEPDGALVVSLRVAPPDDR